ncbi:lytic transglycosylase domain-containing protein [Parasulfitobacter algicola]|uniref:lytic transglycosylase domain-containing protein n=1 Tax=Parasulfitobacter algicola TaxID=2614809 RepID=UPI001FE8CAB0|nr:lytic transglycosylase domain-containing protein [Sulfitobacter algicola]
MLADQRLTAEQFLVAAENCASSISPDIMAGIVHVESRFHPYAIGVGGQNARSIFPSSKQEAIAVANQLVANGERFDAGIAQINIENFDWLDLTIPQAFDVCINLSAAEKVLRDSYDRARTAGETKADALRIALSTYNTGHSTRGVRNGYVGRVMQGAETRVVVSSRNNPTQVPVPDQQTPDWDVYGSSDTSSAIVFTQ